MAQNEVTVILYNDQGVGFASNRLQKRDIWGWIKSRPGGFVVPDVRDIRISVQDHTDKEIGHKSLGSKRIRWY